MKFILAMVLTFVSFVTVARDLSSDMAVFITGDLNQVKAAVQDGADVNAVFNEVPLFIHTVMNCNDVRIVEYLIGTGANYKVTVKGASALFYAASSTVNDPRIVELLIKRGVVVNDDDGESSALSIARLVGNTEAEKILLRYGAR